MISSKVIVALDFDNLPECLSLVGLLSPQQCRLKVGKELFTACGPDGVRQLHDLGFEIFLDLKFHDIPNTVYKAVRVAAKLGVWMLNVHASGGEEMLKSAVLAIQDSAHQPLLTAVTVLTSLSQQDLAKLAISVPLTEQVLHLAKLAYNCGVDGVVCSAQEANIIKQVTSVKFLAVSPGIRLHAHKTDDQTRIMTPREAIRSGADYLVIGRPITQAPNPSLVLAEINAKLMN